jgi:TPP-dependent pyruvate/acetoin dehydrogenase alpha subunit
MSINLQDLIAMYRFMVLGRTLEQALSKFSGGWHPAIGEEAVVVGTHYNLKKDDVVAPHYRGIPIVQYMRGASLRKIWAGLMGKRTSYHGGRFRALRGPFELNILGTFSGALGPSQSIATGAGLAAKLEKSTRVAVTSFGDGTTNRGDFHESINLAAILKLPVVFVCQNNQYAVSMPVSRGLGCRSIVDRALGYGIPGVEVDGNDVEVVYEAVQKAVERARKGMGPSLIEAKTYRISGHWVADPGLYRPKDEVEEWQKKDPLILFQKKLFASGLLNETKTEEILKAARSEIAEACKEAEGDPFPGEDLLGIEDVFAPEGGSGR